MKVKEGKIKEEDESSVNRAECADSPEIIEEQGQEKDDNKTATEAGSSPTTPTEATTVLPERRATRKSLLSYQMSLRWIAAAVQEKEATS